MEGWRQIAGRIFLRATVERVLAPGLPFSWRASWLDLCNRNERLLAGEDAGSRICDWQWSSYLEVCRGFPRVGGRLLRHSLRKWPIRHAEAPPASRDQPGISVVVPVGGKGRLHSFPDVLESIFGQRDVAFEVIVVEQSETPLHRSLVPPGAKYIQIDGLQVNGYNKCACLNAGVRASVAPYVLLHDGDIVVTADYLREIVRRLDAGFEAVQPVRFLFYLGEKDTLRYIDSGGSTLPARVAEVRQNFAGGSVALRRDAFWAIGGMDEAFAGWGQEDVEFQDRLRTLHVFRGRFAPAMHLWHPDIRHSVGRANRRLSEELSALDPSVRIARLLARSAPEPGSV